MADTEEAQRKDVKNDNERERDAITTGCRFQKKRWKKDREQQQGNKEATTRLIDALVLDRILGLNLLVNQLEFDLLLGCLISILGKQFVCVCVFFFRNCLKILKNTDFHSMHSQKNKCYKLFLDGILFLRNSYFQLGVNIISSSVLQNQPFLYRLVLCFLSFGFSFVALFSPIFGFVAQFHFVHCSHTHTHTFNTFSAE